MEKNVCDICGNDAEYFSSDNKKLCEKHWNKKKKMDVYYRSSIVLDVIDDCYCLPQSFMYPKNEDELNDFYTK